MLFSEVSHFPVIQRDSHVFKYRPWRPRPKPDDWRHATLGISSYGPFHETGATGLVGDFSCVAAGFTTEINRCSFFVFTVELRCPWSVSKVKLS